MVEESEVSTDEEPVIEVAVAESDSEAPQISEEVIVEAKVEVNNVEVEVAEVEIDIVEVAEIADIVIDDVEVAVNVEEAIQIDDVVEATVAEAVIDKVITPIEGTPGTVIVSPAGQDLNFTDIFGPSSPGYDMGERDATPI